MIKNLYPEVVIFRNLWYNYSPFELKFQIFHKTQFLLIEKCDKNIPYYYLREHKFPDIQNIFLNGNIVSHSLDNLPFRNKLIIMNINTGNNRFPSEYKFLNEYDFYNEFNKVTVNKTVLIIKSII